MTRPDRWTLLCLAAVCTACNTDDENLTKAAADVPPVAEIVSPEDGTTIATAEEVTLVGLVSDRNGPHDIQTTLWNESVLGVLHDGAPDVDGVTRFTTSFTEGAYQIHLILTDAAGLEGRDTIELIVLGEDTGLGTTHPKP